MERRPCSTGPCPGTDPPLPHARTRPPSHGSTCRLLFLKRWRRRRRSQAAALPRPQECRHWAAVSRAGSAGEGSAFPCTTPLPPPAPSPTRGHGPSCGAASVQRTPPRPRGTPRAQRPRQRTVGLMAITEAALIKIAWQGPGGRAGGWGAEPGAAWGAAAAWGLVGWDPPRACISHPRAAGGQCCCPTSRRLPAEPMWTEWGAWGPCSRSCGSTGTRVRRRSCQNARKLLCAGHPSEVQQCPPTPCPGTCPGDTGTPIPVSPPPGSAPMALSSQRRAVPSRSLPRAHTAGRCRLRHRCSAARSPRLPGGAPADAAGAQ